MNRSFKVFPVIALVAGILTVAAAPTAQAASDCHTTGGLACYYDGANYSGTRGVVKEAAPWPSGPCQLQSLTFNTSSSLSNNSVNTHTWYTAANFGGSSITVSKQSGRATLASGYNNNIRSWKGTCYGGVK